MIQAVVNAFKLPDLRKKIVFTLVVLILYRIASHVPVPGVDATKLKDLFANNQLLGLLDIFSGGAMANFSVMAMGVYPFITAQIILQLLQPLIPALDALAKEGEEGRDKLNRYTHWLTVPMAALQAFGQSSILRSQGILPNFGFTKENWLVTLSIMFTLTAGTIIAVWLGELISERGIGNGLSIIIFGGIAARIPQSIGSNLVSNPWTLVVFAIVTVVTVAVIVVVQEGQRRIPVQYGKRVLAMRGNRLRVAVRPEHAHSDPCQYGRHDSADLCPELHDLPGHDRRLFHLLADEDYRRCGELHLQDVQSARDDLLAAVLHPGDCVHLLLHGRSLPAAESARRLAAPGWVHPRHPAGKEDRRLSQRCPAADHAGRRTVPGCEWRSCLSWRAM